MRYIILILINSFVLAQSIKAQHCRFDGAYIAGIRAVSANDTNIISNLKITTLDENSDTLRFSQYYNSDKIDQVVPHHYRPVRFLFAKDNYVLVSPRFSEGRKLKIEDIDGEENGGHFETMIIDLPPEYLYPLCTNSPTWKGDFKPIIVNLVKKNK